MVMGAIHRCEELDLALDHRNYVPYHRLTEIHINQSITNHVLTTVFGSIRRLAGWFEFALLANGPRFGRNAWTGTPYSGYRAARE
ncbi:membrane protein, partial [Moniliophthora roreri]